ncbi:MAG: hypothetical protein QOH88_2776 [Verrucomicrobiota bacterium]
MLDRANGSDTIANVSSEEPKSSAIGCVVAGLIGAAALLAILYSFRQAPAQSLDVWHRAAWIFAHFKDDQAFPPKAELCAAPFCRRVDTAPKYVGGNPGHRSETRIPFCPEHNSHLPSTGSRFDDLARFIYWISAMAMSWIEAVLVLSILCYPLILIWTFLRPDSTGESPWRRALPYSAALGMAIGGAATVMVWGMFAWW